MGGDETAGCQFAITSQNKDGILAGLLCSEAVARRGKSLAEPWKTISNQVGSFFRKRENFRLTPEVKTKFTEKLKKDSRQFCGQKVGAVVRKDGLKRAFRDGSWVLLPVNRTEPVVRVCSEARSERGLKKLRTAAKSWIFE